MLSVVCAVHERQGNPAPGELCAWHVAPVVHVQVMHCTERLHMCGNCGLQVMVAEVDSHKMFRMVADVKALAVLLKQGASIPAPYQLAASLKQQKSWDGM